MEKVLEYMKVSYPEKSVLRCSAKSEDSSEAYSGSDERRRWCHQQGL